MYKFKIEIEIILSAFVNKGSKLRTSLKCYDSKAILRSSVAWVEFWLRVNLLKMLISLYAESIKFGKKRH